jgi:exopolysaccharide biosynthesis polyprenyl glycosylphosphotransferase
MIDSSEQAIGTESLRARRGSVQRGVSVASRTDQRHALEGFRKIRARLAAADAVCLLVALLAFQLFHPHAGPDFSWVFVTLITIMLVAWVGVFHAFGLYGVQHLSAAEEFRRIIGAVSVGVVIIAMASALWGEPLNREWLAWTGLGALTCEMLSRGSFRLLIARIKRQGRLTMRTLLIGTNAEAEGLARWLNLRERGFNPIGYVATSTDVMEADGIPVVGHIDDLDEIMRREAIECVFVPSTLVSAGVMKRVSRACRQTQAEIRVSSNLTDVFRTRLSIQRIDDLMTIALRPVRLSGPQAFLKRSFDLMVASVSLILVLPLLAVIWLAIRITSPGPALFRQSRVTSGGRVFIMYKFRTMVLDPKRAMEDGVIDLTKPFFKMRDDPRLTRVGRLLRASSLDELLQLWNVIRGDMSLVGPRPLPVEQVEANLELLGPRHEVRAGITGWWQISGRSELDSAEALRLDLQYIENWSLGLDIFILFRTLGTVLARSGAW